MTLENEDLPLNITEEHVTSRITGIALWQPKGTTLTVAAVFLVNGTIVVGKSACVSQSIFSEEKGQNLAVADARRQIWDLEGYLLKEKLAGGNEVDLPASMDSGEVGNFNTD